MRFKPYSCSTPSKEGDEHENQDCVSDSSYACYDGSASLCAVIPEVTELHEWNGLCALAVLYGYRSLASTVVPATQT